MMVVINDGGPAFPSHNLSQDQSTGATTIYEGSTGLTLRDYFAAKAVPALLAQFVDHNNVFAEHVAALAYQVADEMIKARAT